MPPQRPSSREVLVDCLCDFLYVAWPTILYRRAVYPQNTFQPREKYGVPVYMTRSPLLETFLFDTIKALREYLIKNSVTSIVLALRRPSSQSPLSRYVFDVDIPSRAVERLESDRPGTFGALEDQFRALILRLCSTGPGAGEEEGGEDDASAGILSDDGDEGTLTFDIVVYTKGVEPTEWWIPAEGECRRLDGEVFTEPLLDADESERAGVRLASRIEFCR